MRSISDELQGVWKCDGMLSQVIHTSCQSNLKKPSLLPRVLQLVLTQLWLLLKEIYYLSTSTLLFDLGCGQSYQLFEHFVLFGTT